MENILILPYFPIDTSCHLSQELKFMLLARKVLYDCHFMQPSTYKRKSVVNLLGTTDLNA